MLQVEANMNIRRRRRRRRRTFTIGILEVRKFVYPFL
jgi:hypothetical protein